MKIRMGFVSNSSSSSFICDLTGRSYEGYDGEYEVDNVTCEKGHEYVYAGYCDIDKYVRENGNDALPVELCIICNGKAKQHLINRMKKEITRLNLTAEDLK